MTVSTTTIKNSHSGNGTAHSFAYGFKIFADADLDVIVRSSTGTETVKTLNTDYIVTNAGSDSGGNVLFKFNTGTSSDAHFSSSDKRPQNGETVILRRGLDITQSTDYVANDPFPAESHENALDRLTLISQELQEELDRSIKLSRTNTMTSTEFTVGATDRADKVLAFDSSGEISVTQELGTFKGDWAASTAYVIRDIVKDTSTNNILTNANSAKYSLIVDAASATTSATNAASSATAAASSATAAASSASTASTQASNASTSASTASTQATNAASSATAAANAQAAAEAALDTFDDRFLGAKSSNPSVDNDGNALLDGALYFDTTNDIMKVYDLTNTQWRQLTLTSTNQTNVNTVAGIQANVTTVAGISSDVTTVAGISSNVSTVAGAATNVNNVGGSITNVNTVASNISGVNSFAERYRVHAGVPGADNDLGDLVFDTTANTLKVFGSSGFQNAGSSVNGTSDRFTYNITGTPTTLTGASGTGFAEANSNTLAYDAGFIDVYLNGVKMVNGTDVTVTSGNSVVFASALSNGDVVDIVTFGTFEVANIVSTGALNSGSITSGFGNINNGTSTLTTGNTDINGTLNVQGETTLQTHLNMGDNDKIKLGASGDLEIFHDGSKSVISDEGTGVLWIAGDSEVSIGNPAVTEYYIRAFKDGAVQLMHDNSTKLATSSSGVTVTGDIANTSGDLTVDVAGDITLDADGGDVKLSDGGTVFAEFTNDSTYLDIKNPNSNQDIMFKGVDDGSTITALQLDMSDAGTAIFNHDVKLADNSEIILGSGSDLKIFHDGSNSYFRSQLSDADILFVGSDGGNIIEAGRFDMSAGGRLQLGGTNFLKNGDLQVDDAAVFKSVDYYNSKAVIVAYSESDTNGGIYIDFLNSSGNRIGSVKRNGTSGVSYNTSSDYRLKENVSYEFDATTRLKQLKPCRFNWIADEKNTTIDGFIAHEVSSIVPEAVSGEKDALEVWKSGEELPDGVSVGDNKLDEDGKTIINPQGIDQSKLVPLLTKALQEQQATIEALTARITALENA